MYKLIFKYHKIFLNGFKVLTVFLALYYLWRQREIWSAFTLPAGVEIFKILLILTGFSLLNWFFEIKKWQGLAGHIRTITWTEAAKQTLMSFSVSLLTPNRIGEYGAKSVFYAQPDYKKVWALTFASNFAQLFWTFIMGVAVLLFWWQHPAVKAYISQWHLPFNAVFLGIIAIGLIAFVIYIKHLKSKNYLLLHKTVWQQSLFYAGVRYAVFSSQFALLLYFLSHNIGLNFIYPAVFLSYFMASLIPVLAFFDWAVKSSVSVLVFGMINMPGALVFNVVSLMWLANFLIPFLAGLVLIWHFKFHIK